MIDYRKAVGSIQVSDAVKRTLLIQIQKEAAIVKPRHLPYRRSLFTVCCLLAAILVCVVPNTPLQHPNSLPGSQSLNPVTPPSASPFFGNHSAPAADYRRDPVSFHTARDLTGWPLKQASSPDFLEYVLVTIPTQQSPDLEYDYTFGSVRLSPVFLDCQNVSDFQIINYGSHTFYVDGCESNHTIVYSAPAYTLFADIDARQKTQTEAFDLILSLIF